MAFFDLTADFQFVVTIETFAVADVSRTHTHTRIQHHTDIDNKTTVDFRVRFLVERMSDERLPYRTFFARRPRI
jgi:hypothetical protein